MRDAKSEKVERRNSDLRVFADSLYKGGREKGAPWAVRREPLPFPKEIFLKEFWKRYKQHTRIKDESVKTSIIGIAFQRGAPSKSSDYSARIQALIDAASQD